MSGKFIFGTVGSPISTPKKPGGSVGAIEQIKSLGLGALELGWVQAVRVTPETCKAIHAAAAEKNISISIHAPYFINLNANDEEWPKSRKRLMDAAFYGEMAGATDIIFHPGSYFNQPPEDVLAIAIERLKGCISELRGQNNYVILRPETMGKSAMLGSLHDTLVMSKAIEGVLPCIDFAHLHARPGDGSMNTEQEWTDAINGYAQFLGKNSLRQLHIHLSGIEYSAKGERNHVPLQDSDLNLNTLFKVLYDHGCSGRILCESPIMEEDALYMQRTWEEINNQ